MVNSIDCKKPSLHKSYNKLYRKSDSDLSVDTLYIKPEDLSHESEYCSALLNLIKYCEEDINAK